MFDYTRNLQLALTDRLRRAGLGAGAGLALLIGAGFLLAALWTWLADHLGWGALGASLAIGIGFLVIGLLVMLMARKERHPVPTTDELKAEVEQRLMLAADAAIGKATGAADAALERASQKANRLMEQAEQRVHSVADSLSYKADRLADRAEARVYGTARRAGEQAAQRLGLPPDALRRAAGQVQAASQSRAAAIAPLIGAFAVGMTLASRFQDWRQRDTPEWDATEDWMDDPYEDG
ncbi:phage holin family protein [Paracoccus sp. J55]|uniref:phage holin family protein n=1 Tax=Paracoccus sp. J55 TaxID=935849 RepID=UPI00048F8679|nr:phage holin family protein [Paracoccus sp. J55]